MCFSCIYLFILTALILVLFLYLLLSRVGCGTPWTLLLTFLALSIPVLDVFLWRLLNTEPRLMSSTEVKTYRKKERKIPLTTHFCDFFLQWLIFVPIQETLISKDSNSLEALIGTLLLLIHVGQLSVTGEVLAYVAQETCG